MGLKDYIQGKRKGKAAKQIELEAMNDPFLNDALEGFDSLDYDHKQGIERLQARLAERVSVGRNVPVRKIPTWRRPAVYGTAAALLICIVFSGIIYNYYTNDTDNDIVADVVEVKQTVIPPQENIESENEDNEFAGSPIFPSKVAKSETLENTHITETYETDSEIVIEDNIIIAQVSEKKAEEIQDADYLDPIKPPAVIQEETIRGNIFKGKVIDNYGYPIIGAVVYSGDGKGTITDIDGEFRLEVMKGQERLHIRYLGYDDVLVDVSADQERIIAMNESTSQLDEVVVIGYGTQKKSMFTGSTKAMKGKSSSSESKLSENKRARQSSPNVNDLPVVQPSVKGNFITTDRFILVDEVPSNTFGIYAKGDSYILVRDAINSGRLPSPNDVRIEEMINYFHYDFPNPKKKERIRINHEAAQCPWDNGHLLVLVNIQTHDGKFGGSFHTVAKDVKLQVEFNPTHVSSYRLLGYESRMLEHEDFNNDSKDAGDLGVGHTVTALYEIVPTGVKSDHSGSIDDLKYQKKPKSTKIVATDYNDELMTVKLRYKDADSEKSKLMESIIRTKTEQPNGDFYFASAVAMFGQLLRHSEYKGESSYDLVIETARKGLDNDEHGYRREFIRLVQAAKNLK